MADAPDGQGARVLRDRTREEKAVSTNPTLARQGPHPVLLDWLVNGAIEHEVHEHTETFTARETARAEGVDPRTFAKVVGVATDDGRTVLLVLDATDQVDLHKARRALSARDVRLLDEAELAILAPGCDTGAIPAVGALFDLPMYADYAVREDYDISFNAGSHRFTVRVERAAWERATGVEYADLAEDAVQATLVTAWRELPTRRDPDEVHERKIVAFEAHRPPR
jgi:Ala-tRNA(Pro) deacylase